MSSRAQAALAGALAGAASVCALIAAYRWAGRRRAARAESEALAAVAPRELPRVVWPASQAGASWSEPLVLQGVPLGTCCERWDNSYLGEALGDLKVSVHVSRTPALNFASKNFEYAMMPLHELLSRAATSGSDGDRRYYYYRSQHPKCKKAASLDTLGALSGDFALPDALMDGYTVHSTILRLASAGLRMWLHYDVCDNLLACIRGRKRVAILPPCEVDNFYVASSSSALGSRLIGATAEELLALWAEFPLAEAAWRRRLEVVLEEGDVLFLPALWLHCTEAVPLHGDSAGGVCTSVNVFLVRRDMAELHDPKDVWANRDILPAQVAVKALEEKALPALRSLPAVHREFYCRKLAAQLLEAARSA